MKVSGSLEMKTAKLLLVTKLWDMSKFLKKGEVIRGNKASRDVNCTFESISVCNGNNLICR